MIEDRQTDRNEMETSSCSTPYTSAPSSPSFYPSSSSSSSSSSNYYHHDTIIDDFQFDFSGQLDTLSSADELFHAGKIKPLFRAALVLDLEDHLPNKVKPSSLVSKCRAALSPKRRPEGSHDSCKSQPQSPRFDDHHHTRGRSLNPKLPNNTRKGKAQSRSLSPLRVSEFALLHHQPLNPSPGKKWRLKDFLLFRSASDGRAAITGSGKDPLNKYYEYDEGSFRSTEGSVSRRREGRLSAHELHYTANRAVSEEMKRKTSLPYKHGALLGCLGFNPALQNLFGSSSAYAT